MVCVFTEIQAARLEALQLSTKVALKPSCRDRGATSQSKYRVPKSTKGEMWVRGVESDNQLMKSANDWGKLWEAINQSQRATETNELLIYLLNQITYK